MRKIILFGFLFMIILGGCNQLPALPGNNPEGDKNSNPKGVTPDLQLTLRSQEEQKNKKATPPMKPLPDQFKTGKFPVKNQFVKSAELVISGDNPPEVKVVLKGELPNPCYTLEIQTNPPDENNRIVIMVSSQVDQERICTEVISPFEKSIPIDMVNSAPGKYTVWVNGQQVGEFDWNG